MGAIRPSKVPKPRRVVKRDGPQPVSLFSKGGVSRVNQADNYTKPGMRESLFRSIKSRAVQGTKAGQWSARKAQLLAKQYKAKGGGYRD
jgi:hypothetical protein